MATFLLAAREELQHTMSFCCTIPSVYGFFSSILLCMVVVDRETLSDASSVPFSPLSSPLCEKVRVLAGEIIGKDYEWGASSISNAGERCYAWEEEVRWPNVFFSLSLSLCMLCHTHESRKNWEEGGDEVTAGKDSGHLHQHVQVVCHLRSIYCTTYVLVLYGRCISPRGVI